MPATAPLPLISPAASGHPGPSTEPRPTTGDGARAFDGHLDAARQERAATDASDGKPAASRRADRRDDPAGAAASDPGSTADGKASSRDAASPGAAAATTGPAVAVPDHAADGATATGGRSAATHGDDGPTPDAASVAGAMLALLGQAMPANASVATGGAAKVMAASMLKAALGGPSAAVAAAPGPLPGADGTAPEAAGAGSGQASPSSPAALGLAGIGDLLAAGRPRDGVRPDDKAAVDALAGLLQPTPSGGPAAPLIAPHALAIASPVGSHDFAQQLGQQVAWLGGQDIKQARIRLHPEELGSLDVRVSVQHTGQVDVSFAAQHPATVHALQQTLPQLDALLAQQGLSLGQAQVGHQSGGGDTSRQSSPAGTAGETADGALGEVGAAAPPTIGAVGLLDAFA
ncbi:MAG: flagellar hook-length control protein FliK [Xanthomonadaceae bacterium]|nr:flagellar hook-length control protein FliK [Xanthomonadaceae bacterium]